MSRMSSAGPPGPEPRSAPAFDLLVLYASQEGTSQDLAERFSRRASRRRFSSRVVALDDIDIERVLPTCPLVVVFASTTGDGEMPDNASASWRFLRRRELPADLLAGVAVAVFGCGDSSYEKFNAAARMLSVRLAELGAKHMCERGLGDDQSPFGVEGDYEAWLSRALWPALEASRAASASALPAPQPAPPAEEASSSSAAVPAATPPPLAPQKEAPCLIRARYNVVAVAPGGGSAGDSALAFGSSSGPSLSSDLVTGDHPLSWSPCFELSSGPVPAAHSTAPPSSGVGGADSPPLASSSSPPLSAPRPPTLHPFVLRENTRLTATAWAQDVRHLVWEEVIPPSATAEATAAVDALGSGAPSSSAPPPATGGGPTPALRNFPPAYEAGDVAVIFPSNRGEGGEKEAALAAFASRLGVALDSTLSISPCGAPEALVSVGHAYPPSVLGALAAAAAAGGGAFAAATPAAAAADTTMGFSSAAPSSLGGGGVAFCDAVNRPLRFPRPLTLRALLERHLDVFGVPRRGFFEQLSFFATGAEEQDKLLELSSAEGTRLYSEYCTREARTYIEVLADFPSVRLPLAHLLELVPPLRPRHFSIASAPNRAAGGGGAPATATPLRVELCVAVVAFSTPYGRRKRGVCTDWMASMPLGEVAYMYFRKGLFSQSRAMYPSAPTIMVGPGTGVAPMRSIAQAHHSASQQSGVSSKISVSSGPDASLAPPSATAAVPPQHFLYFGCRKRAADYLYGPEMEGLQRAGSLAAYATAFSQDHAAGERKVYVQDVLLRDGPLLAPLLLSGDVCVFIAGSANRMPKDVVACITQIIETHGGLDSKRAALLMRYLRDTKRLVIEAW